MSSTPKMRYVAFHEAGHAVLAFRYGRDVVSVSLSEGATVTQSSRRENLMSSSGPLSENDIAFLLDERKIAAAGYLAEIVMLGQAAPESIVDDMQKIRRLEKRIGARPGSRGGFDETVKAELESDSAAITRVAEALIRERTLDAPRIAKLMEDAADNPS